jgi:hypothetical protein
MTPEEQDITLLGSLAGVVAEVDPAVALHLSDGLVGLLGNQSRPERAERLRELAALLADCGNHFLARADHIDPVVVEGATVIRPADR